MKMINPQSILDQRFQRWYAMFHLVQRSFSLSFPIQMFVRFDGLKDRYGIAERYVSNPVGYPLGGIDVLFANKDDPVNTWSPRQLTR
jgi:hypothetical protein